MRLIKHIFYIALIALVATPAWGQKLQYMGGGSMGDGKFQLVYQLSGVSSPGTFNAPAIEGAKKLFQSGAQAIGSSSSTTIVNGKVIEHSSGSVYRYTVTYKADKEGRLAVGKASVSVGGKQVSAPGFQMTVGKAEQRQSPQSILNQMRGRGVDAEDPFSQTEEKEVTANDLFVKIEMSKSRVYEQQAVVCTVKLYTKFPIKEFMPLQQPEYTGFLIEDITPKMAGSPRVENYHGQNYYTAILRKSILYPQKSGTLTINSGEFDVIPVQRRVYVGLNSAIAVPVDGDKLRIKSNAASVNITPLPSPRPAGFTGAVGEFSIKDAITPAQLKTYATANYTVTVTGSGNIKYIKAPSIDFPKEFDTFDAQNDIKTSQDGDDVSGNITFTYQFIPQQVGEFSIGEGEFVYFNPTTEKYETLTLPSHRLHIAQGSGQPTKANPDSKRMTDIHPVHSGDMNLSKTHTLLLDTLGYWMLLLVPFFAFVAILIYYRKLVKERANVQLMRVKRASKVAQRRLKQAKTYMAAGNSGAFYAEVLTASWGYLSDKLGIPVSELSKENIDAELESYGVDAALRSRMLSLLEKCEFAQYAPELSGTDMQSIFNEAASVMDNLENVKRKKTEAK
ncbi:MAG: BatD family protein [Bacteroidales bacterium]|nr:BatD family protein [Bacteroidales bacterium]